MISALLGGLGAGFRVVEAADTGETPMFIAAFQGRTAVVQALIDAGADVGKARNDGMTPTDVAIQEGHTAVVALLQSRRVLFSHSYFLS